MKECNLFHPLEKCEVKIICIFELIFRWNNVLFNNKYRKIIYQCNSKYKNEEKCKTPFINEEDLKKAFVEVFNGVINNKEEILKGYEEVIKELVNTKDLDEKIFELEKEAKEILDEINRCIRDNATKAQDQEEYTTRYNALVENYENIKKSIKDAENERFERLVKKDRIEEFMKVLKRRDVLLDEFDGELWNMVIDTVKVYADGKMVFVFKDGMEVEYKV